MREMKKTVLATIIVAPRQNPRKDQFVGRRTKNILIAIAVIVMIIATIIVAFFASENHPSSTPYVERIVDETLLLNSNSYKSYDFSLPSIASSITVDGNFEVNGDTEGIKIYIMDSLNFASWQNTRTASMYYSSGELKSGNITATLTLAGTYYLVYDNTSSLVSKNVTSQVVAYYVPN
jgi:hypothetical protein